MKAWEYFLYASGIGAACLVVGAVYWIWGSVKLNAFHSSGSWNVIDIAFSAKAYKDISFGKSIFAVGAFFAVGGVLIYLDQLITDLNNYYTVEFKQIPQHLINERDIYETGANGKRTLKLNAYTLPETLIDRVTPSPYHVIGALFIVAGSLIEILEFKGRRAGNGIKE